MINLVTVVGARPQFVKAAAVSRAIARWNVVDPSVQFDEYIVHTGQHYDHSMSEVFFEELRIPRPRINLKVGSGLHGWQTALMIELLEQVFRERRPDWVITYGDTNSTLSAALAAVKLHIPVAHIEAGLRSFNNRMPEEINRVLTDRISTLLFCPTTLAVRNLANEGIVKNVHEVGDVMYDSVVYNSEISRGCDGILSRLGICTKQYFLATAVIEQKTRMIP